MGTCIRLSSGHYLDLANPDPDDFTFLDISKSLSKMCRFGGQCDRFYSVAEHSWHCSYQAKLDVISIDGQRALLMHDAAEAFIGDCVRPLKGMLADYRPIQIVMEGVIRSKFNIEDCPAAVKKIDNEMVIAERHALFTPDDVTLFGEKDVRVLPVEFRFWDWQTAEINFTERARSLGIETGI